MVHKVQFTDNGSFDKEWAVFLDAVQARAVNLNSLRNLLPGNQRNNAPLVSAKASDYLQMLLDGSGTNRLVLADMPADDPDRITDPAQPGYFHAREVSADNIGSGGNLVRVYRPIALAGGTATHLVSRETLVIVTWDGTTNPGAVNLVTETPPTILR